MPIISVRIPQLGEGLQEALLVELLKQPGDTIRRDEPIYVMETDKATTDVESPYAGTLIEWIVKPGTVLAIGSEIARMEVAEGVTEMSSGHGVSPQHPSAPTQLDASAMASGTTSSDSSRRSDITIPPKTRKYLKEVGLLDQVDQIPVKGTKMMPEDVYTYLAASQQRGAPTNDYHPTRDDGISSLSALPTEAYSFVELQKSQITLNYRMVRGAGSTIPVTVIAEMDWTAIENYRRKDSSENKPTGFAWACWAVAQAMRNHNRFRCVLSTDGTILKEFRNVHLGVAVALPGDELLTAVIHDADQLSASEFHAAYERQVNAAREGQDQADESTTVTVSNIGKAGMRIGIPAIVAPAVATLAIGEVYQRPVPNGDSVRFQPSVWATLTFDHRIVNGVGAANFLNEVRQHIETIA